MSSYICAIDQGTTNTRTFILDENLQVEASVAREFEQIYPESSWVEHDPEAIWYNTLETIAEARQKAGIQPDQIETIGITNQRETSILWERDSGDPIHNAIVWQDRRTKDRIEELKQDGLEEKIHPKTGLLLDPYFSASKIEWMLDHIDGARERAARGELAFGTVDSFLLWRLTSGDVHKTDVSNASRTMLMDLETGDWDDELLDLFSIPPEILPEISGNAEFLGEVRDVEPLDDGTPICGMAGDQQSALFGQACFDPGQAKCTYGTGAFLLMNIGNEKVLSENRLLTSAGWEVDGELTYVLEGSVFMAGAMVQWLRDNLGIIDSIPEVEKLANQVESSGDVVVVPSLSGLGAPHWKSDAQGLINGLARETSAAHIARATLEGIALQNVDVFRAMESDVGGELKDVRVDGGASSNDLLMQLQADFLGNEIVRPKMTETTVLGAAFLAGLGAGIYSDLSDIKDAYSLDRVFEPEMNEDTRKLHLETWEEALSKV